MVWRQISCRDCLKMLRVSLRCTRKRVNSNHFRQKHRWRKPTGYDTEIRVFNEFTKEKVPLIFPNKDFVKWYMCGPTVYDVSHVGHASCYVKLDIIHRVLKEYYDIHPVVAIGITDVSEEIYKKSKLLHKPVWKITRKYTTNFFDQMNALNVLQPTFKLKVSDHIGVIQNFVDLLIRRRAAYKGIDGSVYFSTEADPNYGRFREVPVTGISESHPGKRDPRDFALWKLDKDYFNSPWGRGIPGWHIECSAMASHIFGDTIDLHSGGSDLIFPHHENEEAQSTCYHKCDQWVNYWLHTGMVNVGDVKMSKSLGNFLSIAEFLNHYKSDHLRMFCFMSSYKTDLNFDDITIQLGINICDKVSNFLEIADSYVKGISKTGNIQEAVLLEELEKTKQNIKKHLANDFGTSEALKEVMLLIKLCLKMLNEKSTSTSSRSPAVVSLMVNYVRQFFRSFGFLFTDAIMKEDGTSAIDNIITTAVDIRSRAREASLRIDKSQWKESLLQLCDNFRSKLLDSGILVSDLGPGQSNWSFKSLTVENKTLLKDVIDYVVWFRSEIQNFLTGKNLTEEISELSELCRYIQIYFGTLGINIVDNSNGISDWTFPNFDNTSSPVLERIVLATLEFQMQVKEVAEKLSTKETKDELLCLCESFICDLNEFGVNVDEKNKCFDVKNVKGMSLMNQAVDITVHFREQIITIANLTNDSVLKEQLFKKVNVIRKNLASNGFYIMESSSNVLSCWKMKYPAVNKLIFKNIIDVNVKLIGELISNSKVTDDYVTGRIIVELCDSVVADLRSFGIVVHFEEKSSNWNFEPSKMYSK